MLLSNKEPQYKRQAFKEGLQSGKLMRFPGAFAPLVAPAIERAGFEGVYISGAVMSSSLGVPDIGLLNQEEVVRIGAQIAAASNLPSLIDIDTGFGETMNAARTISLLETAGLAGCHMEDQVAPKRCGHLDNKSLVEPQDMARKVKAAADARKDKNFVLIARTDARASEGLEAAINRAKAYVDAGADAIFPEALQDRSEFEKFRSAISVPLLANMTEFGKSPSLTTDELSQLGYNIVIWPVTLWRLAMGSAVRALDELATAGTQNALVEQMQTRAELYDLLKYEEYNKFDQNIYNFTKNR